MFAYKVKSAVCLMIAVLASSCMNVQDGTSSFGSSSCRYARYFDIIGSDTCTAVVTISPYDGMRDTLEVTAPFDNLICMSSSNVAALASIGADSVITGVSGLRYISTPSVRNGDVKDIGFDSFLDYESVVALDPDVLVAYTVSGAEPQYIAKLRTLGVPVLVLHDHLEEHPLARAEYLRLFGALTGRMEVADSVFSSVEVNYMCNVVSDPRPVKVLMNIPYGDVWYIPGECSYMSRLIRDAGGVVSGAAPGAGYSRPVDIETAYALSQQADLWLNPGYCRSRRELSSLHQLFPSFGPLAKGLPIYNNTLRMTLEGGNDFWESGAVRPDLVLEDLVEIFDNCRNGVTASGEFNYFFELEQDFQ